MRGVSSVDDRIVSATTRRRAYKLILDNGLSREMKDSLFRIPFGFDGAGGPSALVVVELASDGRLRWAVDVELVIVDASGEVQYPSSTLGMRGLCALIGFGWAISALAEGRTGTGVLLPTSGSFFVPNRGALGVPAGDETESLVFLSLLNMMDDVRARIEPKVVMFRNTWYRRMVESES